ncbi:MAG TPA: protein kinase, partial [Pseudomonadota bacterium]|nr:protein kinase [Pseudomonadota bacterium]
MVGQQIGNYRLVKLLGAGGMGMVYEAVHDGIGGRAAIKVLRPEIASNKDATQRFFSEARAANLIAHPGIVHIFDCGYTSSGTAYLTMEFLEGETLTEAITAGPIPPLRVCRIGAQIARGLQAVHDKGIV